MKPSINSKQLLIFSTPRILFYSLLSLLLGCGDQRPSDAVLIEIHSTLKSFTKHTREFTKFSQKISAKLQYIYSHGESSTEYEQVKEEFINYLDAVDSASLKKHQTIEVYAKFSSLALDYLEYQKATLKEFDRFYTIISKPQLSQSDRDEAMKVFRKLNQREEEKIVKLQGAMKSLYQFLNNKKH